LDGERLLLWSAGQKDERVVPLSAKAALDDYNSAAGGGSGAPMTWAWLGFGCAESGTHFVLLRAKTTQTPVKGYAVSWRDDVQCGETIAAGGGSFALPAIPDLEPDECPDRRWARGWAWNDGQTWAAAAPCGARSGGGVFWWRAEKPDDWRNVKPKLLEDPVGGEVLRCRAAADGFLWMYVARENGWTLARTLDDGAWADAADLGPASPDRPPGPLILLTRPERPGWCGLTDGPGAFGLESCYFECNSDGSDFAVVPLALRRGTVESMLARPEERWVLWREPESAEPAEIRDEQERLAATALRPIRAFCWRPRLLLSGAERFGAICGLDYVERAAKRHAGAPTDLADGLRRAIFPAAWRYWMTENRGAAWVEAALLQPGERSLLVVPDGCERMAELFPERSAHAAVLGASEFQTFARVSGTVGVSVLSFEIRLLANTPGVAHVRRSLLRGGRLERTDEIAAQKAPDGGWKIIP
jgi:hypothetical protein